jgi:hypothetical protein
MNDLGDVVALEELLERVYDFGAGWLTKVYENHLVGGEAD